MISSSDLNKCLKHLSVMGNRAPYDIRQRVIEIAAILSKELDVVVGIENAINSRQFVANIDQNQLLKDNIQLYQENSRLVKENIDLKDMLESKAQSINHKIQNIHDNIIVLNQTIDKFK